MRYRQVCWMILGIVFLVENGQLRDVYGMPLDLSTGGSKLCSFDFGTLSGEQQHSPVAYEVLFRDKTSFIVNSSYCILEIWNDATRISELAGNKRSAQTLKVRLKIENPELLKIYVGKEDKAWFISRVISIMRVICPDRKFKSCLRFLDGTGTPSMQRRLLSVDQLYKHRDPNDGIPFQPILLLVAGAVILVIAGSLCADCNKSTDDESVSEARPQLVSCRERSSQHEATPREEKIQEEIVFESKDVVIMETAEKIEGDSVDANNHVALYEEPTVSVQHVPPQSVQQVAPKRVEHVQSSVQHVQQLPPQGVEHVTEGDHKGEKTKSGSKHDQRGSKHEHEHEEHRGKFWKRRRSSKKSTSGSEDHRTSGGAFKDDEHKQQDRRSRKESKEQKGKSGKAKDRKGSTDSEEKKDERKVVDEDRSERPREATPTLERHSRGLPAPPPPPGSPGLALPNRPIPERQISAPGGTAMEDDNYEMVEPVRKTKSVENVEITADDNYDAVRVEVGKPRPPSFVYDSINVDGLDDRRASDIYEVVEDTSEPVDDLYDEVEGAEKKNKEKKRLPRKEESDEDGDPEDPYSKIKKLKREKEALENSELYEEVDKRQESGTKTHDYSVANNELSESIRNRSQSDTASLKRPGNEFIKRANTIDVVRPREGEVTQTEGEVTRLDYLYAKVDLSKKTKRHHSSEGVRDALEGVWSDDNPPPLPPVYVSSKQVQIEMGRNQGTADSLYDEVGPSATEQERSPNMELSVSDYNTDDAKRLSAVSDNYELVEVRHVTSPADDNYSGIVDEGPRPKVGSYNRAEPAHVETNRAPANTAAGVSSSNGEVAGDDEVPHYELVTPRTTNKEKSNLSNLDWV